MRVLKELLWGLFAVVSLITAMAGAEELSSDFSTESALKQWKISGEVAVDPGVTHKGKAAVKVGPGGKAVWNLRDTDGSGKVSFWVKDEGGQPENAKSRAIGPRWGVLQSDGRVLVFGKMYAPFLDGGKTYVIVDSDQKNWHTLQYVGEKQNTDWNLWEFNFDSKSGITVSRNGKLIKRYDWQKGQIKGFNGITLLGDMSKSSSPNFWVSDVQVTLGPAMNVNPSGQATVKSVVPEKDPAVETKVELVKDIRNIHPRLFFTKADLPGMREWLKTDDGKEALKKMEDTVRSSNPPKDRVFLGDATDGQRQGLWSAPTVGMHYLLTGDQKSKEIAIGFMKVFLECEHWEVKPEPDAGMSSANIAIGAAMLYDWLYDELEPEFRTKFRDKLLTMARRQYYGGHLNLNKTTAYWQGDPANNHRWHRNAGMTLCVLAAAEDDKEDDEWILTKLKEELDYVNKWLPEDGSTHEGPGYMIFGLGHLILGMQAADHCLGTKYMDNTFYKYVPMYMLSSSLPGFAGLLANGDCLAGDGIGSYANSLYYCAAINKQGNVIAGIRQLEKHAPISFWLGWMDVLWKRPATAFTGNFTDVEKSTYLPDMGILNIRDNWTAEAVAAMFKSSPLGGFGLNKFRTDGGGMKYVNVAHDDFDANSFIIFNNGELTAQTDGYSKHKQSANHNTILVNGSGQMVVGRLKENLVWNQPSSEDMSDVAVVTTLKKDGDVTVVEGEAAKYYPAINGGEKRPALKQYRRSFIWVADKYILVLDDIESAGNADITWLMQGKTLTPIDEASGKYKLATDGAECDFQVVSTVATKPEIKTGTADHKGKPLGWKQLHLTGNGDKMRFASVYNPWHKKGLSVELKPVDDSKAVVTVKGDGINDTWEWVKPQGLFVPSDITGNVGGKTVTVSKADAVHKPE